jgi:hypothetical protein
MVYHLYIVKNKEFLMKTFNLNIGVLQNVYSIRNMI